MLFKKIRIRKHERGLLFRDGDFIKPLAPGVYRIWFWSRDAIEIADTLKVWFQHALLEVLITDPTLREQLVVIDLVDSERALIWKDGRLLNILGPGRYAHWKTESAVLNVETFDISSFRFAHARLQQVLTCADALRFLEGVQVSDNEDVLLFRDGVLIDRLAAGLHVFWKGTGKVTWKTVDRREQVADVAGQEIITSDKVTLRVNLLVTYRVNDAVRALSTVADATQALYREAQLALRAAVGTRTLDALLADKESVGGEVRDTLSKRTSEFGVLVLGVGLRDIVLPGDMKTLLNQVIAAQKEAEANLIKRREETAAARSQANTAKLLAESPQLSRLKELEMLKEVLSGSKATFVFGGGDLAEQVRGLVSAGNKDA
jgi:regulator of protease activity HflC (stomatin/prohibitin superfamily)